MNKHTQTPIEAAPDQPEAWCHLSPLGEWPGARKLPDGTLHRVVQRITPAALQAVANRFAGEKLVDFEHRSRSGANDSDTSAAGWITALDVRDDGLWGKVRFTDTGLAAVVNRRLRYLSPVWDVHADGTPVQLLDAALTNKPNFAGALAPVVNKTTPDLPGANPERSPIMDISKLALALGLPEDAGEDAVLQAIAALQKKIADAEAAALEKEADDFVAANKEKIGDDEEVKRAYVANKETTIAIINAIAIPKAAPAPVTNKAIAKPPSMAGGVVANRLVEFEAMPAGKAKDAYLKAHAAELLREQRSNKQ
jgi:phage I-like protein